MDSVEANAARDVPDWLVFNYGPRCTLVCAASVLQKLGARSDRLVEIIERFCHLKQRSGPPARAYIGRHCALDRGIEFAAEEGGLHVKSRTRFHIGWKRITASLDRGHPVILNCYRAPGGRWRHSVLAVAYEAVGRRLLTLDPNDGKLRWMIWLRPTTGWACTATFIEPVAHP